MYTYLYIYICIFCIYIHLYRHTYHIYTYLVHIHVCFIFFFLLSRNNFNSFRYHAHTFPMSWQSNFWGIVCVCVRARACVCVCVCVINSLDTSRHHAPCDRSTVWYTLCEHTVSPSFNGLFRYHHFLSVFTERRLVQWGQSRKRIADARPKFLHVICVNFSL